MGYADADPSERVSIPLGMIKGNMEILLNNRISVNQISLQWSGPEGVILVFHFGPGQKEEAIELGMRFIHDGD